MQLLHDTTLLYSLIATVAAGGIIFSREQEGQRLLLLSKRRMYLWIVPSLSILANSFLQFWIVSLPLFSLAHPELLFGCALVGMLFVPVFLSRNFALSPHRFRETLSSKLRATLSLVLLVFYALIQPLALLYLADHTLSVYFSTSSYFSLVFLTVVAGICALLGGKSIAAYMSVPFVVTIAAVTLGLPFFGISLSGLLTFVRFPMGEAEKIFAGSNFTESSWMYGCTGFCAVTWWIWWIDKGVLLSMAKSDEKESPMAKMFVPFCFVGLALVFFLRRSPEFNLAGYFNPHTVSIPPTGPDTCFFFAARVGFDLYFCICPVVPYYRSTRPDLLV